jgi:O-antigen/teichoic acid export membrane protein
MAVSLFTVRVILKTLGVVDYGIYNVVGGIVLMFSFFSNTMASASQRFFAFELGRNDIPQLKKTFSLTITIYAIIAASVLLLAETLGLWFLNTQMVIPAERMNAANWIYQFSILSFLVTIITIPYNAAIIARENMKVYAYVSIIEVGLKLVIVYILVLFKYDKLKLYSILIFATTCLVTFIYRAICKRKYEECHFQFYWDKGLFNSIFSFSTWKLVGSISGVLTDQGINIVTNLFFGPVINAARAIANQVNYAISSFSTNFYTAVRPQITKYYSSGELNYLKQLVFQSSKFSFYLLLMLSMPIIIETEFVLKFWLRDVADYMVLFTRLIIIFSLINSLENPLSAMVQASGIIKKYQLLIGSLTILCLPISYVLFKLGLPPQVSYYTIIIVNFAALFLRLWIIKDLFGMNIIEYLKDVLFIIITVCLVAAIIPVILFFSLKENSLFRFLIISFSCELSVLCSAYLIGLKKSERTTVIRIVKKYLLRYYD